MEAGIGDSEPKDDQMLLRWSLPVIALCVEAAASVHGQAPAPGAPGQPPPPPIPTVVAAGQAIVRLPPDRAYLMLSTETRAPKPAEAQQQNAQAMAAVQQKLEGALPRESVRTLGYSLEEEYDFVDNRRRSRGFRAVNTIEVRLDDISRVGEILDLAVAAGATSAHNIRFDLKDRQTAERQALRLAVADARARAEAAAAGANATLVAVIRIEEQGKAVPVPRPMMAMVRGSAADAAVETPVTAGEIEIEASVLLTATIK
jgi:uncharacterized protein